MAAIGEDSGKVRENDCIDDELNDLMGQMKKIRIKNEFDKKCSMEHCPWLVDIESVFLWNTKKKSSAYLELLIQRAQDKLNELNLDVPDFSMRRYSLLLQLVLEYTHSNRIEKADETMKTITMLLGKESAEKNPEYKKYEFILNYLMAATNVNLLALRGDAEHSKRLAQHLLPVNEMSNSDRARLCAIKSTFFSCSEFEEAANASVDLAREALMLEPNNHEWMFLLAKALRQQRKETPFSMVIPKEELLLLEQAVEQKASEDYLHYLAQAYMECANKAHRKYRMQQPYYGSDLFKIIQDMQNKSFECYKKALDAAPDNAANLRRVGYGIMNLPPQLADYDLAISCLLKSLDLCETVNILHIIGTFYHRYGKDNKKALIYFEKTANMGSVAGISDMIRVKFFEYPDYDPTNDFEKGLQWHSKTKNQTFFLVQQASYFLFIKRDLLKSIGNMNKIIAEEKASLHITNFKSIFLRMYDPVDFYFYLVNEGLIYLDENKKDEDEKFYEVLAFINTITNIKPALGEIKSDPLLVTKLLQKSEDIINKEGQKLARCQEHNARGFTAQRPQRGYREQRKGKNYCDGWERKEMPFAGEQKQHQGRVSVEMSQRFKKGGFARQGQNYENKKKYYEKEDEANNWRRK